MNNFITKYKEWHIKNDEADREKIVALAGELKVSPVLGRILWHRGIRDKKGAEKFLYPDTQQEYYDPLLMKDMDKALSRIKTALLKGESIVVYGDYDVDGITATALLTKNLRELGGGQVDFYIPDRQEEGYGLNLAALEKLSADCDLLISVDCGISSVEDVAAMAGKLDIIITDHHLPGDTLPPAVAVINPHREDCAYPDKNLAGVGVAFKLCQALWREIKGAADFAEDLSLVALGTVADIVPLLGENRKIVQAGLAQIKDTKNPGLNALIDVSALRNKPIGTGQIGFTLAPRLNASGRVGRATQGVRLLLTEDKAEAYALADELNAENARRQEIERDILLKAEEKLAGEDMDNLSAIVVAGENWHQGVIGIVASRLVDKYYRPTIVISQDGDRLKGSCRSIKGFHMYEALSACSRYLTGFGGHAQAAGLHLASEDLSAFAKAFREYAAAIIKPADYLPTIDIEFLLSPKDLTVELIEEIEKLEPYGMGNPRPLFAWREVQGVNPRIMGREGQHLAFNFGGESPQLSAVCWNKSAYLPTVAAEPLDIVYVPKVNEWQGEKRIECILEEFTPAKSRQKFPTREILAAIYKFLRTIQAKRGKIPFTPQSLAAKFAKQSPLSLYTMECALQIFGELDLLREDTENNYYYMPPAPKVKLDLTASPFYRRYSRQQTGA